MKLRFDNLTDGNGVEEGLTFNKVNLVGLLIDCIVGEKKQSKEDWATEDEHWYNKTVIDCSIVEGIYVLNIDPIQPNVEFERKEIENGSGRIGRCEGFPIKNVQLAIFKFKHQIKG